MMPGWAGERSLTWSVWLVVTVHLSEAFRVFPFKQIGADLGLLGLEPKGLQVLLASCLGLPTPLTPKSAMGT